MKNIVVLIPSFTIEYSIEILSGIYDFYKDKDIRVIITHTKYPHSTVSSFDYQYWSIVDYVKANDIDGYIVVSGLYTSTISQDVFDKFIKGFFPRPIVSIGVDINNNNAYTIKSDCKEVFNDIVSHLKNIHGCKRIGFFSANKTLSEEALERYDAFTNALEKNNLPFYPDLVIDGYFTNNAAEAELLKKYKSKDEIDFDAFVCANDMMASGCITALKKLGVKVPEEVKVVGFDDAVVARISEPKLSTVNQNIYEQGYKAAEQMFRILNKEEIKKTEYVSLSAKFRQSCGCIDCKSNDSVYKNAQNELKNDTLIYERNSMIYLSDMNERNHLITLMDTLRCSNTLKQFFFNLRYLAEQCGMPEVYISLFKDVYYLDVEDNFELPDSLELTMICDLEGNVHNFKPGVVYNPKKVFIASRSIEKKPGVYIATPIFSGSNNYGLMLCKINSNSFADYIVHLKIICNSIAQSFDYTNQITQTENLINVNSDLKTQSRTDELTQIYNRRGFTEQGQALLDLMQETDRCGVIFFADMDGLKTINDQYGHEMGDLAIKLQASVLKSAFRSTDIVGRLGGDEFGIVAIGMNLSQSENIRLKIKLLSEKVSKENNLPFILSCSLGAVDLQKSSVLKRLLSEADKSLYDEKRKKRNARLSKNS